MEMGDKSQLVIMALATRYHWQQVLLGLILASAVVHGLAVAVGGLLGDLIPMVYMKTLAALAFLAFAIVTLRSANDQEEAEDVTRSGWLRRFPAISIAFAFFVSEFGDKTQLATVAATARSGLPGMTWAGATVGMVAADSLGIVVGRLLQRIPAWVIRTVSASIFLAFGWSSLGQAWGWPQLWTIGVIVISLASCLAVVWRQRQTVQADSH
jgi:putative Ca2+/H+ antiporter (TMEM165/GDT1 family)